jgi:hypothetical protein
MGKVQVSAERIVEAPAEVVYKYLADLRGHHPLFLPPAFSNFAVDEGGVGSGTVLHFTLAAGGRTREYRMKVEEPDPGRVLTESDTTSSLVTKFTVIPEGGASRVSISTTWDGAGGIAGIFEKLFAPRVLRGIYLDELERLNAYAREQAAAGPA